MCYHKVYCRCEDWNNNKNGVIFFRYWDKLSQREYDYNSYENIWCTLNDGISLDGIFWETFNLSSPFFDRWKNVLVNMFDAHKMKRRRAWRSQKWRFSTSRPNKTPNYISVKLLWHMFRNIKKNITDKTHYVLNERLIKIGTSLWQPIYLEHIWWMNGWCIVAARKKFYTLIPYFLCHFVATSSTDFL